MNKTIISILLIITIAVPLFFDGHLYSVFDLSKATLLYLLTFILVGVWAVRGMSVFCMIRRNPLGYPILAILFSSIISTVFAIHPFVSLFGTYKRYGGLLTLMVYIVLFFAVTEFVKIYKMATFLNVVILTSSVAALYGIIQSLGLDPYVQHWSTDFGFGLRAAAAFGHPSFMGAYMAMGIPLVLYGILAGKWWMYPISGLLLYALFLSKARSAYVGVIVSLIFFFVLYRKKSYKLIGLTLALIIALSILMPNNPIKRFQSDLKGWKPAGTIEHRLKIGMTCLDIIRDNPIIGIGLDCLGFKFATYYELRYKEACNGNNNRAHNAILSILSEQGAVGLLAWLYIIVIYFHMVLQNRKNLLVVALSSGVVAYMAQNMFSFSSVGIAPLFWLLLSMTIIVCRRDNVIV